MLARKPGLRKIVKNISNVFIPIGLFQIKKACKCKMLNFDCLKLRDKVFLSWVYIVQKGLENRKNVHKKRASKKEETYI